MSRFIFFTKTIWSEPPRLRHQLAKMLTNNHHKVVFFEKPNSLFRGSRPTSGSSEGIEFRLTTELLHHKLRLNKVLRVANGIYERYEIEKAITRLNLSAADVIVNFNYDYYFLREIFPDNKIITVINDDFVCRALFGYEKPLHDAIALTCRKSDVVLAVSYPLVENLSAFCRPELFFPWAESPYFTLKNCVIRNRLIFFGYINNRLNFDYCLNLADALANTKSEIILEFVGPVQKNIDKRFYALLGMPNVKVSEPSNIEMINFDTALAAFIPYVLGNKADDATTIPNKAFPLLARGLPLLITGMPHFLKEPFVFRLGINIHDDLQLIATLPEKLAELQPLICSFVNANTADCRYKQFLSYLDS